MLRADARQRDVHGGVPLAARIPAFPHAIYPFAIGRKVATETFFCPIHCPRQAVQAGPVLSDDSQTVVARGAQDAAIVANNFEPPAAKRRSIRR